MPDYPAAIDPEQLDDLRQRHLGRLLLKAYRAFSARALEKLAARGYTGLALAHTMLLTNIDIHGTRPSALAERIGVSRQAVGNLVHELQTMGYVARKADPSDQRAIVVALTETGWKLLQDVVEVKTEIEAEYGAILGEEQMRALRAGLTHLLDQIEAVTPKADP